MAKTARATNGSTRTHKNGTTQVYRDGKWSDAPIKRPKQEPSTLAEVSNAIALAARRQRKEREAAKRDPKRLNLTPKQIKQFAFDAQDGISSRHYDGILKRHVIKETAFVDEATGDLIVRLRFEYDDDVAQEERAPLEHKIKPGKAMKRSMAKNGSGKSHWPLVASKPDPFLKGIERITARKQKDK